MTDRYTEAILVQLLRCTSARHWSFLFQNVDTIALAQNEPCGGSRSLLRGIDRKTACLDPFGRAVAAFGQC